MSKLTKDEIADEEYGYDFDDLNPGEKAAVTRKFNAQRNTRSRATRTATILAKIGRAGNGVHECALAKGATVAELVKQGNFTIDTNKETVISQSTGNSVDLDEEIEAGEVYIITAEIRSA